MHEGVRVEFHARAGRASRAGRGRFWAASSWLAVGPRRGGSIATWAGQRGLIDAGSWWKRVLIGKGKGKMREKKGKKEKERKEKEERERERKEGGSGLFVFKTRIYTLYGF